ncbi:MAG: lysophospholipid acyltransferase family protein [Polyangiales bacterium]
MRKAWRLFLVTSTLALYFIVLAPLGYGALTVMSILPTRDADARARRLQGIVCWGFRTMHDWLRWIGIIDFDPREVEGALPDGPCIVVANHRTLTDITSIMASFGHMTAAVRPDIFRMRWLRPLVQSAGFVEGASDNPLHLGKMIDAAASRAKRGSRFVLFPEGTRAPSDELLPFGRTAFEIACRADVPVVPLLLHWKHPWLSKNYPLFAIPKGATELRIEALPPVYPQDFRGSSRALRDVVESTFRARLNVDSGKELEGYNAGINRESAQAAHR